jgi:hypothetical protein
VFGAPVQARRLSIKHSLGRHLVALKLKRLRRSQFPGFPRINPQLCRRHGGALFKSLVLDIVFDFIFVLALQVAQIKLDSLGTRQGRPVVTRAITGLARFIANRPHDARRLPTRSGASSCCPPQERHAGSATFATIHDVLRLVGLPPGEECFAFV